MTWFFEVGEGRVRTQMQSAGFVPGVKSVVAVSEHDE